jgi:hypothetical protein
MLMTKARYAAHRGCDQKAVILALETERIHAEASGLIDSVKADKEWDENTDPMRSRILPREGSDPQSTGKTVQGDRQPITMQYLRERTEQARVITEAKRLDIDIRRRVLVSAREVEDAARRYYGEIRALRDACLEIPDRLASGLAAEPDPVIVRAALFQELTSIFARFAAESEPGGAGEAAA